MLALTATNVVGVVLFGSLYAVSAARDLARPAFLACLIVLVIMMTALWVRVEGRHHSARPLRRLGRVIVGLVTVTVGTPIAVLMPLFWLQDQLPAEAGLGTIAASAMALVLLSLVLVSLVNLLGGLVVIVRMLLGLGGGGQSRSEQSRPSA